jgi:1,4-alpha-glucan branching enzyme
MELAMISKRFFKTKNEVEVTFELDAKNVENAEIVADFLDWKHTPMKKVVKSKSFKFKTRLPKDGEFEFRYFVNGTEWVNDAQADQYVPNEYGADNCIVNTTQA